ncbi:MAG TPA: hypothetical protein VJJ46_06800 [Anaerolineales bacterium]|nr:hypothetical protein [Anaerolineales bacterium]
METGENWKARTLLVGSLLGAFAGAAAAYLLVRRSETSGEPPRLGTGESLRLGLLVLGLLRQVSQLGEGEE